MNRIRNILKKRENKITLIFFVITMVVACSPLLSRYCINGHDLEYHLLRIESLKEGILIGRPFMKVNTLFYGGVGYASTLFYSDLFMHIPALLRVLGFSIGKSFHIYTAMIFVLCYISTFYCVWKMSLSKFAGTVAAILLTLCPYHMDDMLVRTACGENAAFIFLPLAIYGVFNVLYEGMDRPWVFGLGFAGLIITHPATFVLTFGFSVIVLLIHAKLFIKTPRLFVKMCVVAALAVLVTSYQWLPMLEQFANADFYVSNNWTDMLDASVGFADVASQTFPCVGFVLLAFVLPRFFLSRKDYPILTYVDLMIAAAVLFAIGATNLMPWEKMGAYFGFLQFPWRLFIMSSVLLAMSGAIVWKLFFDSIVENKRGIAKEIMLIVLFAVTSYLAIAHQNEFSMGYYDYSDDYYSYKPYTTGVIAGEWLPSSVTEPGELIDLCDKMTYDDGSECTFERDKSSITADIRSAHEYVDVPFLYYKGYGAVLTDANGEDHKLEVTGEGYNGLCRVYLNNLEGTLAVKYKGTIIQYLSTIITILFLILIFDLWYLKNKYKKKLRLRAMAAGANPGKLAIVVMAVVSAYALSSCSFADAAKQISSADVQDIDYNDPDAMIDYLNYKNGTGDGDVTDVDPVRINYSKKGYDTKGSGYAIRIDESTGEQVITFISVEEAQEAGTAVKVKDDLYEGLLDDEIASVKERYRTGSLNDRIMYATDALLCMEVFPEVSHKKGVDTLAKELCEDILSVPENKTKELLDCYDASAVLAKAAYVLPDWDKAKTAGERAEELFRNAEGIPDQEGEPVAARLWAAAELYRLTESRTYRSVVDAISMDVITEGSSYEEPGYFGMFAYLMSPYPTNRNVCSDMMEIVFGEANEMIKKSIEDEFADSRYDDKTLEKEEKTAQRMRGEAFLVTMTGYVSVSVEYIDFVENRLNFIYGANLSGVDFTEDDNVLCDAPMLFVITGLCR